MKLLNSTEVARMFGVDSKTVIKWAKEGQLPYLRTPGGTYRFEEDKIRKIRDAREN